MKITEYIQKNKETLPPALAEILLQNGSIWTNDACYGYCIQAMENAGFSRKKIIDMIHYLHSAFDELTVEEAEKKWTSF